MDIDPRRLARLALLATLGVLRMATSFFPTSMLNFFRFPVFVGLLVVCVGSVDSVPLLLSSSTRPSGSARAGSIKVKRCVEFLAPLVHKPPTLGKSLVCVDWPTLPRRRPELWIAGGA